MPEAPVPPEPPEPPEPPVPPEPPGRGLPDHGSLVHPRRTAVGTTRYAATAAAQILGGGTLAVYLPRVLGPGSYALFAVVVTFTIWIEFTGAIVLTAALPKLIVDAGDDWHRLARTVVFAALTGLSAISALVLIAAGPISAALGNEALAPLIRLFAIDFPLYVTPICVCAVFAGRRLHGRRSAVIAAYWVSKPLLTILFVEAGLGMNGAILGSIVASVIMLATALRLAEFGAPAPLTSLGSIFRFTWPLILAHVLLRLLHTVDMFSVQVAAGDPRAPAYYGIAVSLELSLYLLLLSVATAVAPGIAGALKTADRSAARSLTNDAYRFVIVVSVGALAAYLPGRTPLIEFVFGAEYASAALPTGILVAGAAATALAVVGYQGLVAADRPRLVLAAALVAVPVSLVLLVVLVPRHGVVGAAAATTSAQMAYAGFTLIAAYRLIRSRPSPLTVIRCFAAGAVVVATGVVLNPEGLSAILLAGARMGAYVALLRLTGELKTSDFSVVIGAFRLGRAGRRS